MLSWTLGLEIMTPAVRQETIFRPGYTDTKDRIVVYFEQKCFRVYIIERNFAYLL